MAWPVKLDPTFPVHPKLVRVGPLGRELVVAALCHCNRGLTDGNLTVGELRALTQYDGLLVDDPLSTLVPVRPVFEEVMERVIEAGIFEWRNDGVIHIHDYEQYQSTREKVLTQQAKWRDKKRRTSGGLGVESQPSPGDSEQEGFREKSKERVVCPSCGPLPISQRRLVEHIENLHPELAAEVA